MLLVYWYHLFVWSVVKFYFNFMDFVKRFVCPPICSNNFYTFFTISFVNIFPFSNFSLHLQSLWFSPLFLFLESHFSFPCFYQSLYFLQCILDKVSKDFNFKFSFRSQPVHTLLSKLNVQIYQQLPWLASSIASCRNFTTFGILEMTPAST